MQNTTLSEIRIRYQEGKYQEALSLVEKAEREGLFNSEIMVLKGRCIQLVDKVTPYNLSDAEYAFEQALEIDENFTPAITELAWFYLNVLDDAVRAAPLFERAIKLYKSMMTEAVIGMGKCLLETKTEILAKKYLEEALSNSLDLSPIQIAIAEIEQLEK